MQDEHNDHNDRSKWTLVEWGVIISLFISSASGVFTVGVVYATQQQQGRDIDLLKTHDGASTDRLARIETKLDFLIEAKARADR